MQTHKPNSINEYISSFPIESQAILEKVRATIRKSAPEATEVISYSMPAFKLNGRILIYFAGYKNHIGFYPTGSGIEAFKNEISEYKSGKGSIQFALDQPIPYDLITKIVKFRAKENLQHPKTKM